MAISRTVATAACLLLAWASPEDKFKEFENKFGKAYESVEERARRLEIFIRNLAEIEKFEAVEQGSATYTYLTPLADLSAEELSARNGLRPELAATSDIAQLSDSFDVSDLPTDFDWVKQGAVNPVKNQAQCGSCWAFATVANVEGANFVSNKHLISLSEQELVDCDKVDSGCSGGLPSNAYENMIKNNLGLELESAYPYAAKNDQCTSKKSAEKVFISGYKKISTDEDQIAAALMQYGPLAIGINANPMQMYQGGVADPKDCNPAQLDHGVAIVGFGVDAGTKYWKIRNSWGASWGEEGYYRIIRGVGKCGLNTMVTSATGITAGNASSVTAKGPEDKFREFEEKFQKVYESVEQRTRRLVNFIHNLAEIEKFEAAEQGSATYSYLTPLADLSAEEFSARNGFRPDLAATSDIAQVRDSFDVSELPSDFDWVKQGAVNPVKNQAQCGSCWAFATVANIEGANFVSNKQLISLSEQELVDCDKVDSGCSGGLPSNAYNNMIKNKLGLELESVYPYEAKNGQCTAKKAAEKVFISGYQKISTDEDQIAAALMKYGPLAIGINANPMQTYSGGVSDPKDCSPSQLDHGVAIVGFGVDAGTKYWKIRNSWGASWGEEGYYRIVRGVGRCGLNTMVTSATGVTGASNSTALPALEIVV